MLEYIIVLKKKTSDYGNACSKLQGSILRHSQFFRRIHLFRCHLLQWPWHHKVTHLVGICLTPVEVPSFDIASWVSPPCRIIQRRPFKNCQRRLLRLPKYQFILMMPSAIHFGCAKAAGHVHRMLQGVVVRIFDSSHSLMKWKCLSKINHPWNLFLSCHAIFIEALNPHLRLRSHFRQSLKWQLVYHCGSQKTWPPTPFLFHVYSN